VSFISISAIHIKSLDRATGKRMVEAELPVNLGWWHFGELPIAPPEADGSTSRDEDDKLMRLARFGIAFAADYKQGMDPVGAMLNLIERGLYVGTFKQIAWTGPGRWVLTTLPGPTAEKN
jgi:hypothetical protein